MPAVKGKKIIIDDPFAYIKEGAEKHSKSAKDSDDRQDKEYHGAMSAMNDGLMDRINKVKLQDKITEYFKPLKQLLEQKKITQIELKEAYLKMEDGNFKDAETLINKHHHKEPEKKKSKPSLLEALTEAHNDNFISKSAFEKYKDDIASGNTKALKARLKSYEYEHESDDDKELVEKYIPDEEQYNPKPLPKKARAKQIPVKDIGSELHKRTHKAKMSPETKKEIMKYVMLFP